MNTELKPINTLYSSVLFGIPAIVFIVICWVLVPLLHQHYGLHPALSWFIGGLLTFVSLFFLAIYLVLKDGFRTKVKILTRFRLKKMTSRDWKFTLSDNFNTT